MTQLDDTQPNIPVQQPYRRDYDDEPASGGPGCLMWSLIIGLMLVFALAIVGLAGAAAWTEGQKEGDRRAAQAEQLDIAEQLTRIPGELANNNLELVGIRLNYLETVVPDAAVVPQVRATVTAMVAADATAAIDDAISPVLTRVPGAVAANDTAELSNNLAYLSAVVPANPALPQIAATATAVRALVVQQSAPEATEDIIVEAPTVEVTAEAPTPQIAGGFDPAALLTDAQAQLNLGNYEDAYDLLDAIIRIDENYERATVRGLLQQTLTQWANNLYSTPNTENLAEAIRVTNLAEDVGFAIGELDYERLLAGLYLDARRAVELGDHGLAVSSINTILQYQTTYKGENLNQMLFDEYVRYARVFDTTGEPCRAVAQYQNALNLFANQGVNAQRTAAEERCEQQRQATANAPLGTPGADVTPVAPIGAPES